MIYWCFYVINGVFYKYQTLENSIKNEEAWKTELEALGRRSNLFAGFVAFLLVPLHIVTTDYLDVNERFSPLSFGMRLGIAVLTLLIFFVQTRVKLSSVFFSYVTFFLVSISDGYMASLSNEEAIQSHLLAYCLVLIGANITFFWAVRHSIISILISMLVVGTMIYHNSSIPYEDILRHGGYFTFFLAVLSVILMWTRYSLYKKNFLANLSLAKSNAIIEANKAELEIQNKLLENKNSHIMSSITYAKRIQESILPNDDFIKESLIDSFIFYRPKDIVSGDFYWFYKSDNQVFIAVVDCTGHGVPGAFMSLIGYTQLNKIVIENGVRDPSKILQLLNNEVVKSLKQSDHSSNSKDGMDICLVCYEPATAKISFAGANRPLYYFHQNELKQIKGTSMSIGGNLISSGDKKYETHVLNLDPKDAVYLFSDGYVDQFGGAENRKYLSKRFRDFLAKICIEPIPIQKSAIEDEFVKWQGDYEQTDDVLVIGFQIS